MRKILALACLAAVTFAVLSCSTDSTEPTGNGATRTEIRLSSDIKIHNRAAYTASDTQIPAGENVQVWVDDTDATQLHGRTTLTTDGSGNLTGDKMFFPSDGGGANIYALHTNAVLSGIDWPTWTLTHTVVADQSALAGYAASDLLYARLVNVTPSASTIPLTFNHLLTKLRVAIVLADGLTASDVTSVTIGGTTRSAQFTLDKTVAPGSVAITAAGTASDIAIGGDVSADFDAPNYNDAVIVPQTVAANTTLITVKLTSGDDLIYRLAEETTFESGKKYALHVTVSQSDIELRSSVDDWRPGETIAGDLVSDNGIVASGAAGDLTWALDEDGNLTISGEGSMPDYDHVATRSSVKTRASVGAAPWNDYLSAIKTIVVTPGVTSIGQGAFKGCVYLTTVTLPKGVTSIGGGAFSRCVNLMVIVVPITVIVIADDAFEGCARLPETPTPQP